MGHGRPLVLKLVVQSGGELNRERLRTCGGLTGNNIRWSGLQLDNRTEGLELLNLTLNTGKLVFLVVQVSAGTVAGSTGNGEFNRERLTREVIGSNNTKWSGFQPFDKSTEKCWNCWQLEDYHRES